MNLFIKFQQTPLFFFVTIYISIHPLNRLYLKAIQEMLKIKNDWI